ncbi:dihydrofolate reductase [Adelges cooleyi]|uniref:dihydrofolate reductase n=1 Tax=Adelges cooleyi TaxID=133065 RepID=UPI00217FE9C1|nr:dihydrofolate reductase [Adelges cooleyi]
MDMSYNLIAAVSKNSGIGYKGNLPWRLKKEMDYFTQMTTKVKSPGKLNAVIMGRLTWESIPNKYRPLTNRLNVVISKTMKSVPKGILLYKDLKEAIEALELKENIERLWVIGGAGLYNEAIKDERCTFLYVTKINKEFICDTFFPHIDTDVFQEIDDPDVPKGLQEENEIGYEFKVFKGCKKG